MASEVFLCWAYVRPGSFLVTSTSGPGVKVLEFLCTIILACAFERNKEKLLQNTVKHCYS